MTDATPVFESPKFERPEFDDAEDGAGELDVAADLDEELEEDDAYEEDDAPGVNRAEGGTAAAVLDHIARSIVGEPDAVSIETGADRNGVKLSLHVAPGDMGRIIGKRGRVAQALRTVVRAAAARDGSDASVDIVD